MKHGHIYIMQTSRLLFELEFVCKHLGMCVIKPQHSDSVVTRTISDRKVLYLITFRAAQVKSTSFIPGQ